MAKHVNPFAEDDLPPFDGFPKDTLRFLSALKKNNNREWFTANKDRYENSVKAPMESLLSTLGAKLRTFDPDIAIEPKKAMYRIYRDIRFSADKTPYKTHAAAAFTYKGTDRKYGAAFYFHIAPGELGIGGGLYAPSSDQLKSLRENIAREHKQLTKILSEKKFVRHYGELWGDLLTRVPAGYPADHPAADLLRRKQFLCWTSLKPDVIHDSTFVAFLADHVQAMAPFVKWLAGRS